MSVRSLTTCALKAKFSEKTAVTLKARRYLYFLRILLPSIHSHSAFKIIPPSPHTLFLLSILGFKSAKLPQKEFLKGYERTLFVSHLSCRNKYLIPDYLKITKTMTTAIMRKRLWSHFFLTKKSSFCVKGFAGQAPQSTCFGELKNMAGVVDGKIRVGRQIGFVDGIQLFKR